ncbi:T7SS effector LXG polymorphic toxin [Camelliibacillus cellulosilyticus]|uniref:T7SS effector LXG polymorphic toxin n=1 Tax=Camelliibacillus cellulosilyticus TaxID=2174486 RepID=A0ABV9GRV2_9BACL
MKVLKVSEVTHNIDLIIEKRTSEKNQVHDIQGAMKRLIDLEDALKGEGGDAIREFFLIAHVPVLLLLQDFQESYINELKNIKEAVGNFESNDGLIREDFIDHDVTRGIAKVEQTTHDYVNDVNSHLRSVSDIVSAFPASTGAFDTHIRNARTDLQKTVEDLHQLDRSNTSKLKSAVDKLNEIKHHIEKIKGWTKDGVFLSDKEKSDAGKSLGDNVLQEILNKYGLITLLRNTSLSVASAILNSGKLLKIGGLSFKMFKEKGKIFIKIKGNPIKSLRDFEKYREALIGSLGGKWKWDRDFLTQLVNKGVPLYNNEGKKVFRVNSNKFIYSQFDDLGNYVERLKQTKVQVAKDTFKNEMKFWEYFRGWKGASTITKLGKGAGVVGVGLTVADDFKDSFFNDKGQFEYKGGKQIKKFVVDTSVDIGAGAASMATGAAIGSAVGPVGTVGGALIGAGIFLFTNAKMIGDPPKSMVEVTKEFSNKIVDKVGDFTKKAAKKVEDCIGSIGNTLHKIFW